MICFNVRRPSEVCLASVPVKNEVMEYDDRYHYWVNHENGLSEMVVYKHETISVEILYLDDAAGKNILMMDEVLDEIDIWRLNNEDEICRNVADSVEELKRQVEKLFKQ